MAQDSHHVLPDWKTLGRKTLYHTKIFDLIGLHRKEEGSGREGEFFMLETRDWVNIIAITTSNELVLVEQYRHGTAKFELEIVGGLTDEGETPREAALRELQEETGYTPTASSIITELGVVDPNPAFLSNRCHLYLATNVELTTNVVFDDLEHIAVRLEPLAKMDSLVTSGEITHSLVLNAFYLYRLWESGKLQDR